MLEKAAGYEIQAIMQEDKAKAAQYAEAATDVLRQVRLVCISEKIVAEQEVAALIERGAQAVWSGFKEVAVALFGVVVQGAMQGLLGGGGGKLADAASEFLGGSDD